MTKNAKLFKHNRLKITKRLEESLESGDLKGIETNSNYIEFWYWYNFNNVEILVDGVRYTRDQIGKLSRMVDSGETVRTIWSKMRSELKKRLDLESQEQFKNEFGIEK